MAKEEADPLFLFAEALRSKGGVENRTGVLEGERFDLFRGKDLVRWVKVNPAKAAAAALGKGGEGPEEQSRYLGQQLLRRNMARRVDRQNKKPLPGSKKLVKFPRKLAALPPGDAVTFVEDGFYIWHYQRPTSPWTYVWAALVPLVVVGCCLFPLAPVWAKVAVFYLSSGLLTVVLGVLLARGALALLTWLVAGRTVWLLPNIMSEELPVSQIFRPLVSVTSPGAEGEGEGEGKSKGSKWGNHPATRAAVGAAVAALLYMLYSHSPGTAAIRTEASRYKDEMMDWLGVQSDGYEKLAGNATTANATGAAAGNATDAAGEAAPEAAAGAAGAEAGGGEAEL